MALTAAQRQADRRERLRKAGKRMVSFVLTEAAWAKLNQMAGDQIESHGAIVEKALNELERQQQAAQA